MEYKAKLFKPNVKSILKLISYTGYNILVAALYGYLTIEVFANANSRIGALALSIVLPLLVIAKTPSFSRLERLTKFGSGLILYAIIGIVVQDVQVLFSTMFLPAIFLTTGLLYFGRNPSTTK